ncbi:MAG: PAS domain-containing sensor histidine kinase [Bacteroidales bacterium]|nr:PAS domain-containing sensor histidine kinase [Bacteroidales bacterium]
MFSLDIRTASIIYVLIMIISTFVITLLLKQYRNRYKGVHHILYCFALQTLALVLILLRGNIPIWISFDLANIISTSGIIFFYSGIEIYTGKKSSLKPNLLFLTAVIVVQIWFTFLKPDITARHLNISILWLIVFVQCIWFSLYRVPLSKFRSTFPVNLVCSAFCLVCLARIIKFLIYGIDSDDNLSSDWFDATMIIVCQILLILLTYSLIHMFGYQLLLDIKQEEEKFSKAFNTSPYGIIITSFPEGQIIDINKGFQNITGYSIGEISGKTVTEVHLWSSEEDRMAILEEIFKTDKVCEREYKFRKKSGELVTCLFSSELITINNEKCALSSFNDISERKKYEIELLISKEKAEESDRLKTAFLQNISHEIRTPLNAIVGFSALLGEADLDSESKQSYIDLISRSSDHLLAIVSDIMEISNIEAGIIRLKRDEVNINFLMNDLFRQFKPRTLDKGIDLLLTTDLPENSSYIQTDKTKLVQVLSNLLSNALKFTDNGQIEFGYKLKNDNLEFFVTDTGIGIPDSMYDKIFDRFFQGDYSSSRPYEGTGLGLSISKAYTELLGGKIWFEPNPGLGTIFYFTIPYKIQTVQLLTIKEDIITNA